MAEPTLSDALRELYALEINCGLSSFWDGGWTAWIGDGMNGRHAQAGFLPEDFDMIAPWLLAEADRLIEKWRAEGRVVERRRGFHVVSALTQPETPDHG